MECVIRIHKHLAMLSVVCKHACACVKVLGSAVQSYDCSAEGKTQRTQLVGVPQLSLSSFWGDHILTWMYTGICQCCSKLDTSKRHASFAIDRAKSVSFLPTEATGEVCNFAATGQTPCKFTRALEHPGAQQSSPRS